MDKMFKCRMPRYLGTFTNLGRQTMSGWYHPDSAGMTYSELSIQITIPIISFSFAGFGFSKPRCMEIYLAMRIDRCGKMPLLRPQPVLSPTPTSQRRCSDKRERIHRKNCQTDDAARTLHFSFPALIGAEGGHVNVPGYQP